MHTCVTIYIIITWYNDINCACVHIVAQLVLCVSIYKMIWSVVCGKFDMQHDLPNRIV